MTKDQTQTRDTIVNATLETLQTEGFAGATSRAIARRGGFNQALVFYYFGSLDSLLLAALERTSAERLARYREALAGATTLGEIVEQAKALNREDRESGHVVVLVQLIAGCLTRPSLAARVVEGVEPWREFTKSTVERLLRGTALESVIPIAELADALVTYYLGASLLFSLDDSVAGPQALLARVSEAEPLLAALLIPAT
jgi:AcrR family transcriptional regulator